MNSTALEIFTYIVTVLGVMVMIHAYVKNHMELIDAWFDADSTKRTSVDSKDLI